MRRLVSGTLLTAGALLVVLGPSVGCRSLVWFGHSPDRRQRVEVWQQGNRQLVILDGKPGPSYRAVGVEGLVFSPDGLRMAYPVQTGTSRWQVCERGRRLGPAFTAVGAILFSPDSRRLAYAAKRGSAWHVVVDNKIGPAVAAVMKGTLRFDPKSLHLVYVARVGGGTRVYVDQRPSRAWRSVAQLRVARRSRVAYAARQGSSWRAVIDGKPGKEWEAIKDLTLGPKGRRVVFFGRRRGRWHAVMDGITSRPYDELAGPRFNADGSRVAWAAREGNRARVVTDLRDGLLHTGIRFETLRWDTAGHLLYIARTGRRYQLIHDGRAGPFYDAVTPPVVATGSHHWAYLARIGKRWWLWLGAKSRPLPRQVSNAIDLRLSPDGRRFAFVARRGRVWLVIHDRGTVAFDLVVGGTLVFGPDGADANGSRRWRWACLAGERKIRDLFVAVEGLGRRAFDLEELTARAMGRRAPQSARLLRRWVRAELALAVKGRP